jgi:hypothetical protein
MVLVSVIGVFRSTATESQCAPLSPCLPRSFSALLRRQLLVIYID